jgi:hypothetical protein
MTCRSKARTCSSRGEQPIRRRPIIVLILAVESGGSGVMAQVVEALGLVGAFLVAIGYGAQIVHLVREKCSAGVSIPAWCLWLTASVLIAAHAFVVFDVVFIASQVVNITAIVTIIALARRHEGMACADHRRRTVDRLLRLRERASARAVLGPAPEEFRRRIVLVAPLTSIQGRPFVRALQWSPNASRMMDCRVGGR